MKTKYKTMIFLLAACITFTYSGCFQNDEDGPKKIVQKYFNAVKSGDIDGAIECFTPAFQQQYKSSVSLGGILSNYLTGIDGSSILGGFMSYVNQNTYKDCTFIVDKIEFDDEEHEHASVHVTVEGASDQIPGETTVKTVKYDDQWYVEQ